MAKKSLFPFFLFIFTLAGGLGAIELTLEENKAESGTIGYVDIEKVFRKYSVKSDSKEKFLAKIKEKEDILGQKKEQINNLKAGILKLKQEKQLADTLPGLVESVIQTLPQQPVQPLLPGTTTPVSSSDTVKTSTAVQETPSPTEISVSTGPGNEKMPVISMPGVGSIPLSHFKFSVSTSPAEIEAAILRQEEELRQREDELKKLRKQFDKELADYEDIETEKILGNIYLKLKELSVREGVSVVVDKKSILFGHRAVDLTEKLVAELEADQ